MQEEQRFTEAEHIGFDPPPLAIEVHSEPDSELVVDVRGELDLATGPILKRYLASYENPAGGDGHAQRIVFRLSGLEFIDACGLNALLTAMDGVDGNSITIREPSSAVRRLLALVGMEPMIETERQTK